MIFYEKNSVAHSDMLAAPAPALSLWLRMLYFATHLSVMLLLDTDSPAFPYHQWSRSTH